MQSVTAITKVQNGTILLEQSMTAHMSLLTATGIFGLEKRNLKSVACLISVLSLKIKRKIKKICLKYTNYTRTQQQLI